MTAGEIEMWIPTSSTLQRLARVASFSGLRERLSIAGSTKAHPGPKSPILDQPGEGIRRLTCFTAGGVPGRAVGTYLVGAHELVVVDPGDPSPEALAAVLLAAESAGGRIVGIALTSADPDRSAGADELAERTDAPVFGPPGSGRDLPFAVTELAGGDRVPAGDSALHMTVVSAEPPTATFSDGDGRPVSRA
jgi:glyoxylase-like metal-dependent hydrolase (beta-lactamase superfamily II)